MRRSHSDERGGSIRKMTGTSAPSSSSSSAVVVVRSGRHLQQSGASGGGSGSGRLVVAAPGRSIVSGIIGEDGNGTTLTYSGSAITAIRDFEDSELGAGNGLRRRGAEGGDEKNEVGGGSRNNGGDGWLHSYVPTKDDDDDDLGGIEEEAIVFPQSTHSWLFTHSSSSLPFWFAVAILALSDFCLILALLNFFQDTDPNNRLGVPYQVRWTVRTAQYLTIIIALIMEEELPTGLYMMRMILREPLRERFPAMKYRWFLASAIARLVMGYLFLLNTFLVVVRATEVLDIFYDVLALQFLQQLDDIAFNLAKINVFGVTLKHAALSKCFRAEFEKQPFALRKRLNVFLKGVYFFNLLAMFGGMAYVTYNQVTGEYHSESITVTFGEKIWNDAIVTTSTGEETMPLLFSFFNGVYLRNGTHHGRPVYTEQNKFDGSSYVKTTGAEIKYCRNEKAWVFAHVHIRKSNHQDESDCPWLLRSAETREYNLLDVTGDWTIWTGSIERDGHFSAIDNECQGSVDCNYHGTCRDGKCACEGGYYGMHCEHNKPCSLLAAVKGSIWSQIKWPGEDDFWVYQRPVYRYEQGGSQATGDSLGLDLVKDNLMLMYTGSRWLGTGYINAKIAALSREYWRGYITEYHAFWGKVYSEQTIFVSDPTTKSDVIGVDMYMLGKQGEEFGPLGQLYPLSEPKGSGYMRCVDNEETDVHPWDIHFIDWGSDFSEDSVGSITVDYELKKDRQFYSEVLAKDCTGPITGIGLNETPTRTAKFDTHDSLSLKYSLEKSQLMGSNIWNAANGTIEFCHFLRSIDSETNMTAYESLRLISESVPA